MDLIENYINKKELDWNMHLRFQLFDMDNINEELKNKITFISQKMDFLYGNLYEKNPFRPSIVWSDGSHSFTVQDLSTQDVKEIRSIINYTKSPILLGKIHDILWILENDNNEAMLASQIYYEYYLKNRNKKNIYKLTQPLKRSLYILCYLKKDIILKERISKILSLKNFTDKDQKRIVLWYIADLLDKKRKNILSSFITSFENILTRDKNRDDVSLSFIEIIINYYKSINNYTKVEKWQLKYSDICEELEKIKSPHGYEYLTKAINILNPEKQEQKINNLMLKRDESQKKLYNSFQMHEFSFDNKEINNQINAFREKVINIFINLNSIQQFSYLLKEFNPVSVSEIEKQIKENKKHSIIANLFPTVVFGEDKTIIYEESKATTEEKKEYEYSQQYKMFNPVTYSLILQPYIYNSKIDIDLLSLIDEIISHNLFVPIDRIDKVKEDIVNILNKNIRLGLFDLIVQFENGCRIYLHSYKSLYPLVRNGSKYSQLSLDSIFVQKKKTNKFRTALCEILDKDLVLEIEYLACRPLSANIRNKYMHNGCGSYKEFFIDEAILSYLLIKAYCLGYDSYINKKDDLK